MSAKEMMDKARAFVIANKWYFAGGLLLAIVINEVVSRV